jgi:hypothetical protein
MCAPSLENKTFSIFVGGWPATAWVDGLNARARCRSPNSFNRLEKEDIHVSEWSEWKEKRTDGATGARAP